MQCSDSPWSNPSFTSEASCSGICGNICSDFLRENLLQGHSWLTASNPAPGCCQDHTSLGMLPAMTVHDKTNGANTALPPQDSSNEHVCLGTPIGLCKAMPTVLWSGALSTHPSFPLSFYSVPPTPGLKILPDDSCSLSFSFHGYLFDKSLALLNLFQILLLKRPKLTHYLTPLGFNYLTYKRMPKMITIS